MTLVSKQPAWNLNLTADSGKRRSELCKAKDYQQDWYMHWCDVLGEEPNFHRKQWEYVYVLQALYERGCMQDGKRGIGFAVGTNHFLFLQIRLRYPGTIFILSRE
jgi:hypothetical protein